MWKAKVVKKVIVRGLLTVGVEYSNGDTTIRENYTSKGQPLDIEALARKKVAELEGLHTLEASIKDGDIDLTVKPVPTPDPITPAPADPQSEAKEKYRELHANLIRSKTDLDLGLISQSDYDALLDECKKLGKQVGELK